MKKIKNMWKTKGPLIVILVLSLLLLTILILVANTASKRVERGLKKADKAYEEGSFFLSGTLYDKVLEIDSKNIKAYLGMVSSYALSESTDSKAAGVEAYERALAAFKACSADEYNENNEAIVSTLRYGKEIFKDDDKDLDVLASAYEVSLHDQVVGEAYADALILDAEIKAKKEDYRLAMDEYEKASEITPKDERINEGISKFILSYLRLLSREEEYSLAKDITAKYQPLLTSVDFEPVLTEVLEREELSKTKERLLKSVYDSMLDYYNIFSKEADASPKFSEDLNTTRGYDYDFSTIMNLDGAEDANVLSQSLAEGKYLYAPQGFDENYTGVAVGLYPYGNLWTNEDGKTMIAYYFFIGDFVNGQRSGKGISFMKTGDKSYELFEGLWSNDAPEGAGIFYISGLDYKRATFGNFKQGYADGIMTEVIRTADYPDELFVGTYEAHEGIPNEVSAKTAEYEIFFPEGEAKLIDVLPSSSAGYDLYLTSTWTEGVKIGAIGYR